MTDRLPVRSKRAHGASKRRWKLFSLLTGLAVVAIVWSARRSGKLRSLSAGADHAWEPWRPEPSSAPITTLADAEARARADIEAAMPTDDAPPPSVADWEASLTSDSATETETRWAATAAPFAIDDFVAAAETTETIVAEAPPLDAAEIDAAMPDDDAPPATVADWREEIEGEASSEVEPTPAVAAPAFSSLEPSLAPTRVDASGWVEGNGTADCPPGYPIKGNASSRIFHRPGESSYAATVPEICFATEAEAVEAGYRERKR